MYFVSGCCFILTCYETVHRTVSAKFINEFGASCLLCFAQFTPPSKRRKAPKIAWTRCPSYFPQSLRVQQVAPTSLYKGGKKVYLFYSARFSHFIDSLKRTANAVRFFSLYFFVNFFSNTPLGSLIRNITSHITNPIVTTVKPKSESFKIDSKL